MPLKGAAVPLEGAALPLGGAGGARQEGMRATRRPARVGVACLRPTRRRCGAIVVAGGHPARWVDAEGIWAVMLSNSRPIQMILLPFHPNEI